MSACVCDSAWSYLLIRCVRCDISAIYYYSFYFFLMLFTLQPQDRQQLRSEKGGKPVSPLDSTDVSPRTHICLGYCVAQWLGVAEFKSKDPGFHPLVEAGSRTVFLSLRVNSCADLYVCLTPPSPRSSVRHAPKVVRTLKIPYIRLL